MFPPPNVYGIEDELEYSSCVRWLIVSYVGSPMMGVRVLKGKFISNLGRAFIISDGGPLI